ncbi:MAG: hypothetical protein O2V44_08125, partial [Candidatus Bathyarchaeota archaeon]|nr:hypothetical protein [Candidatus Bathyarchaeota archaeon]
RKMIEVENTTFVDKVEQITPDDHEFIRSEMAWLAEWIRDRYQILNYNDIRKFIALMVTTSI